MGEFDFVHNRTTRPENLWLGSSKVARVCDTNRQFSPLFDKTSASKFEVCAEEENLANPR